MFFLCGGCEVSLAVEGLFANMSYLRGQFSTVCVLKIALWWAPVLEAGRPPECSCLMKYVSCIQIMHKHLAPKTG